MSRYKACYELVIYPQVQFLLRASERSGLISSYNTVLGAGAKSKNHDELINYTVRVSKSTLLNDLAGIILVVQYYFFFCRLAFSLRIRDGLVTISLTCRNNQNLQYLISDVSKSTALQMP